MQYLHHRYVFKVYIRSLRRIVTALVNHQIKHVNLYDGIVYSLFDMVLHCNWSRIEHTDIIEVSRLLTILAIITEKRPNWVQNRIVRAIQSPWTRDNLAAILHNHSETTHEMANKLFNDDFDLVFNRVRSLLTSKLHTLCYNYVKWIYESLHSQNSPLERLNPNIKRFLIDIYFILIFDGKDTKVAYHRFKQIPITESCQMIHRLQDQFKRKDIAYRVVQMILLKLAIQPLGENEIYFIELVKVLLNLSTTDDKEFSHTLSSLVQLAVSSEHIYIVAKELFDRYKNDRLEPERIQYIIELYIRGLTIDANHLDKAKCIRKDEYSVRLYGYKLCCAFQDLSQIFTDIETQGEFLLNAFCVNPCEDTLHALVKHKEKLLDLGIPEITSSSQTYPTKLLEFTNTPLLTPALCDDLNVVLSSTRMQHLHWSLEWNQMLTRCQDYVEQYKDLDHLLSQQLKYLEIDYNQYKDIPLSYDVNDPYLGVEKGYERFIDEQNEELEEMDKEVEISSKKEAARPIEKKKLLKTLSDQPKEVLKYPIPEKFANSIIRPPLVQNRHCYPSYPKVASVQKKYGNQQMEITKVPNSSNYSQSYVHPETNSARSLVINRSTKKQELNIPTCSQSKMVVKPKPKIYARNKPLVSKILSGHMFGSELTVTPLNDSNEYKPKMRDLQFTDGKSNSPAAIIVPQPKAVTNLFDSGENKHKYLSSTELTSFSDLFPTKESQTITNTQEITLQNILVSSNSRPPKCTPTYMYKPKGDGSYEVFKIEKANMPQFQIPSEPYVGCYVLEPEKIQET